MSEWMVTLTCVKCGEGVKELVEAPTEAEALRRGEYAHNQRHNLQRQLSRWPDFVCWAVSAEVANG